MFKTPASVVWVFASLTATMKQNLAIFESNETLFCCNHLPVKSGQLLSSVFDRFTSVLNPPCYLSKGTPRTVKPP